jgi:hypothetical protein
MNPNKYRDELTHPLLFNYFIVICNEKKVDQMMVNNLININQLPLKDKNKSRTYADGNPTQ